MDGNGNRGDEEGARRLSTILLDIWVMVIVAAFSAGGLNAIDPTATNPLLPAIAIAILCAGIGFSYRDDKMTLAVIALSGTFSSVAMYLLLGMLPACVMAVTIGMFSLYKHYGR